MHVINKEDGKTYEVRQEAALVYTENAHFDEWVCSLCKDVDPKDYNEANQPWVVFLSWGSKGRLNHHARKRFFTEGGAIAYMKNRRADKFNKGYRTKETTDVFVANKPVEQKSTELFWDYL